MGRDFGKVVKPLKKIVEDGIKNKESDEDIRRKLEGKIGELVEKE